MTRLISDMQPDELLREWCAERRRRESPPSLAGIDPDQPREKKPSSGRYEDTLLLLMGCDRQMLEAIYEASNMYQLASWKCPEEGCYQAVLHEHRPVKGDDGQPLTVQGKEVTTVVTVAVHPSAIASKHGIPLDDVKRRIAGVLTQIAENQGRRRGAVEVDDYQEDPIVTAWRTWASSKGGM